MGIGIVDKATLKHGGPAAIIALAQARCRVAELFPAGVLQLDPGAAVLCHKADLDQLLLLGRKADDPGKSEMIRRLVGQYGPPDRFAAIGCPLEDAPADLRLDRAAHGVGTGVELCQRAPARV